VSRRGESPEINSPDYHDYVIKDGRLIGEFDQMYRRAKDIPWHQDDARRRLDCQLAAAIVRHFGPFRRVLEVGSGLGYFADLLAEASGAGQLLGVDVSPEAVRRATELFPRLKFEVLNLMESGVATERQFDLVAIRGCFWYVFPALDQVVRNLTAFTAPGGYLFVAQNFPPLDSEFVGKAVIPTPQSLVDRFVEAFDIVSKVFVENQNPGSTNDNWILFLGRKR
jgi:SAM-dependent methyltransferase